MTTVDGKVGSMPGVLCEMVPDAILVVTHDGRIRFANSSVSDLFGYDPDEIADEPVEVLVPESLREDHVEWRNGYFDNLETRPMGVGMDLLGQRKDGSVFPIDVQLSPASVDGEEVVVAVARDTTEREAVRSQYEAIMETAPDAFFLADPSTGRIIDVNDQATVLTGYSEDELTAMHQADLHPSEAIESYRALFERHVESDGIRSELPDGSPIYVETKDGAHVPVEINARTFELGGREVISGTFRDITERRSRERELEQQNQRLDEFAQVVAHDLRNPLLIADGRLELAMDDCDSEHLPTARAALDRMNELIEDTLTLAKQGTQVGETEPVDLSRLAKECWDTVETEHSDLIIEDPPVVQGDRSRLKQLLENLMANAVEHSHETVSVSIGGFNEGFYVEDTGPGIPAENRDQVFETGVSFAEDGTGFGLTIVKRIVEAHGWDIRITEGTAGGARFEIITPTV